MGVTDVAVVIDEAVSFVVELFVVVLVAELELFTLALLFAADFIRFNVCSHWRDVRLSSRTVVTDDRDEAGDADDSKFDDLKSFDEDDDSLLYIIWPNSLLLLLLFWLASSFWGCVDCWLNCMWAFFLNKMKKFSFLL